MNTTADSPFIDFATLERPSSPNTCVVLPEGFEARAEPDWRTKSWAASPQDMFGFMQQHLAEAVGRANLEADEGRRALHAVYVTKWLKFRDDVYVEVVPQPEGRAALAIYSKSRVGYSDFGTNRKRVDALLKAVAARFGT